MKNNKQLFLGIFVSIFIFSILFVSGASPLFAKTEVHSQQKIHFAVSQVDGRPVVHITNISSRTRPVTVELVLFAANGRAVKTVSWDKQSIAPGAFQEYSMGPLFLSPADSPYRFAAAIYSSKKHRLIDRFDPIGTFTVAH